jgi:large subunit ribosomal protein L5
MTTLKTHYHQVIIPRLISKFHYVNPHTIPKLEKIVISTGLGLSAQNKSLLQKATEEIRLISGQHPILTKSKKSIAGFKIREGMPLGLVVTLRREKMYSFLEKLVKLVFPRIRDFRGMNPHNFDNYGNYNVGITDQLVFPEIDYDKVDQKRGFTISIVIRNSKTSKESYFLLKELGFPFMET